ncbi:MAG: hypothetical protein ACKO1O_05345 [Erythrobacter sp.]
MIDKPSSLFLLAGALALVGCNSSPAEPAPVADATQADIAAAAPTPGEGDSQGDALVAGTPYNATAQIACAGYKGAAPGMCEAGVVRATETGTYVEVKLPDGVKRTIFFEPSGKFLSFGTAEADGTAAMPIASQRKGDSTIAKLGPETYEIPDAFVTGG